MKKSLYFLIGLFILFSFNCYADETLTAQQKEARIIKGYSGVEWGMTKKEVKATLKDKIKEDWATGEFFYEEKFYKDKPGRVSFHFNSAGKLDYITINTGVQYSVSPLNRWVEGVKTWEEFFDFHEQTRFYLVNKYGPYSWAYEFPFSIYKLNEYIWNLPYTRIILKCIPHPTRKPDYQLYTIEVSYEDILLKENQEIQKGIKDKF